MATTQLPGQDIPIQLPDRQIEPVWYGWFRYVASSVKSLLADIVLKANKAGDTFSGAVTVNADITTSGSVKFTGSLGIYNLDAVPNAVTVANTGTIVTLGNFSGTVFVTCWSTGATELFVCGGGPVVRIGGTGASTSAAYNPGAGGYSFFNNSGGSATFGVIALRTRNTA